MRGYLVVANQTLGGDELVQAVRERALHGPSEFWVLVPATHTSSFTTGFGVVANEERQGNSGESVVQQQLDVELQRLHEAGAVADDVVGDEDPLKAIGNTLVRQPFDEIILSTLPKERSRRLRQDLPSKNRKKFSIPLTHIVTAYSHW